MSNQLHLYGSQQFAFPPAVCLLLALFILRNKGSPDNSPPESFMEMGFDTALQIFFGFFSTWRRKSPKQTFIWHCKVENNSYSPLKGAGHSLHMGMLLFLVHEITAVAFILKLRQERPNKKISHPFVTNYSSLAHFDAFKIKEERKQELKLGIFKL